MAALVFAGGAQACVCADQPLSERLEDADAAIVGRVISQGIPDATAAQRWVGVEVEQRVKGQVEGADVGGKTRIFVRTPFRTDCDLTIDRERTIGLLLTRHPEGGWYATACSVVDPGRLVAAGGEPRGGAIKVVIGLGILAIVLLWALRRLRRGTRPRLPGGPGQP